MSLDNYVAFYVAGSDDILAYVHKYIQDYPCDRYTIAFETSKQSHAWCNGKHLHVLITWSDKQYRAFITKLKTAFPTSVFGRATTDQPRTYGKVKLIRDFKKMLAYTIKGNDYISNEDTVLVSACKEMSYEKEDIISECREKINKYLDSSFLGLFKKNTFDTMCDQSNYLYLDSDLSLLQNLKLQIIRYFRNSTEKMPCKSRVLYYAQYYLMYHRTDVSDEQILELFY